MDELTNLYNSISESVRFDSSRAPQEADMPFGKGAHDCLHHFLDLAASFGFPVKNYDNYAGEVCYGEGEDFAVLAHLDVVPAGDGWTKDPFGGLIEDGKIWGRGTMDDKGPAMCALYSMKALKDKGFVPKKQIKLIVGCNEEDGWECIAHYQKSARLPKVGFSPDASFPVIYAEKGIVHVLLHFPLGHAPFKRFSGGTSANMVCASCVAEPVVFDRERAEKYNLTLDGTQLCSVGKSAHGSTPELGINALYPLLSYFEEDKDVARILDCAFRDIYGLKTMQDETGYLTLSPDVATYRDGTFDLLCDIRYPATRTLEEVLSLIEKFGVPYEIVHEQKPLIQDKNGTLVQTLLSVYEECTGKKATPIAIGGGTYARALECGVGFGPEEEDDEPVIHQANEYITLERVNLLYAVYQKALERLCG